jgi:site-specific DNA recombinase
MKLRCAVYARYSSDRQSKSSIADQLRKCREYAEAQGWEVLDGHIYSDEAISGTTSERNGLQRLLEAATAKSFDVALVDDTSRLSRKLSDSINFSERLQFAGVRVVFVSQGIDSDNEQSEVLTAVHGVVDSLYIRELAKKTHRGLEGKVLDHLHHGGRIFGYKSIPIEDPKRKDTYGRPLISGARLEVDERQAKTVRKIFSLYASGLSIKGVAKKMNADGVESPTPRAGRQQSWAPSSIRVILRNERYRGVLVWAKTKKVHNPQTGRRIKRPRPKSEWVTVSMPEQRVVSEKLWKAVQERRAYIDRVYGARGRKGGLMNSRLAYSRYIFSGLLKCGSCGANYVLVSGAGTNCHGYKRGASYGCPNNSMRGTCKNARRVQRDTLEGELLAKLQRDVLSDAAIDYCVERLEVEIGKRFAALDTDMETMRKRKIALEAEVRNLSRTIAEGMDSAAIRTAITEREAELATITARTLGKKKGSLHEQIVGLRKFVQESMQDIRVLLASKHANPAAIRQELARHIDTITLSPDGKKDSVRYKGSWKLVGYRECAEGQNRTAYAGLFRAALYR